MGGGNREMKEKLKKKEKRNESEKERRSFYFFEIKKRNINNQFRFSEIIFRFVIIIEEQGYSKIK